jgi:hypothetical protein
MQRVVIEVIVKGICYGLQQGEALGCIGRPGKPRATLQQEVGWEHFHHDALVSCIVENNN